MMTRFASMAACLALAVPTVSYGQTIPEEEDGAVDLDAIDSLFGDTDVAEEEEPEITDDEGESGIEGDEETDEDEEGSDEADEESSAEDAEDESEDESEEPEISDLTRAFNGYSLCASEAAAELEEIGFTLDVIGEEALLRCSGQRAAYVNAFFFELGPRSPDAGEAAVRASAERLVAQTDTALINVVIGEVTPLREEREAEAAAEAEAEETLDEDAENPSPEDGDEDDAPNEDAATDDDEASDGESDEAETEPDA